MKIPDVNDLMLDKVIEAANSPVCVLYLMPESDEAHKLKSLAKIVADSYDDRIIFLAIDIEENPSKAAAAPHPPAIEIYLRKRPLHYFRGCPIVSEFTDMLDRALQEAR